jgi:hypothetical protein
MANAAAHEQKDDGLSLGLKMGSIDCVLDLAVFRPESAQGNAKKTSAHLMQKTAPVQPATRV